MLTDTAARSAKSKAQPYKLADAGGLYLLIKPTGAKKWRWDYSFQGARNTLGLGSYPETPLAVARKARDELKALLKQGTDPSYQRKLVRHVQGLNTFQSISDEFVAKITREGQAPATLHKTRWLLSLALPTLARRPINEIKAPELLVVLKQLERREHYESAKRLRSLMGRIFRYAIATGRADRDPAADLRGALTAPKPTHHASLTAPEPIGALLRATDVYTGSFVTKIALTLAPLLFVRPGELRRAEWAEFDLGKALWTIPPPKMKLPRPHLVPLSRQALAHIEQLQPITAHSRYLFPSIRTPLRPMSENTLNAALRRMGYTTDEMTTHGFRSMASTRLNEMRRWHPDVIERQLAHGERDQVRAAYNYALYLPERTEMMQIWADFLDILKIERTDESIPKV
jgi:integrase